MKNLIPLFQQQKQICFDKNERDMPPAIYVSKNNKLLAVICAKNCDKEEAFYAAHVCRGGLGIDVIHLVTDVRMTKAVDKNMKLEPGELQKRYLAGDSTVVEAVNCYRADINGDFEMICLPYSYKNNKIVWGEVVTYDEKVKFSGTIPKILSKILSSDIIFNKDVFKQISGITGDDFSEERQEFHATRAVFQYLRQQGFDVADLVSKEHPEWIDS